MGAAADHCLATEVSRGGSLGSKWISGLETNAGLPVGMGPSLSSAVAVGSKNDMFGGSD